MKLAHLLELRVTAWRPDVLNRTGQEDELQGIVHTMIQNFGSCFYS